MRPEIAELEYRLLYSMVVAGKNATFAENALKRFLEGCDVSPFAWIRKIGEAGLVDRLKLARTGNYSKMARGFWEVANAGLQIMKCPPEHLERIHGIGPKTSRFFIIWTRPGARHAALDTHILKWLRYLGHAAPKSTPSGEKYAALEKIILAEAETRGMTPRELDEAIWTWCADRKHLTGEWPPALQKLSL